MLSEIHFNENKMGRDIRHEIMGKTPIFCSAILFPHVFVPLNMATALTHAHQILVSWFSFSVHCSS